MYPEIWCEECGRLISREEYVYHCDFCGEDFCQGCIDNHEDDCPERDDLDDEDEPEEEGA